MQPGTLLAERYRLESVLATGGMGVVYSATDLASGRPAAIKILKSELVSEPRFVERLRREARAATSLAHPNIVEVTDLIIEPSLAFLVMERLEGEPWGMAISNSEAGMPVLEVAAIGRQLLSALEAAHRTGLIHRDVKPDNVFLAREPSGGALVKLLDFGLVKLEAADRLTASHSVLGTWQYMAPEQARGERTDGRADLYAVGACLYYALTKKRPYQAADAEAATFALSEEAAPPLRSLRADLDPRFAAVIERALSKDLFKRWQSAREMLDAISPWAPKAAAAPRIEPESDDDIQTHPVRSSVRGFESAVAPSVRGFESAGVRSARPESARAVGVRPDRGRSERPVSVRVPAKPSVPPAKPDISSEELVDIASSELLEAKTGRTSAVRPPSIGENDEATTRHVPVAGERDQESRPPLLDPESVVQHDDLPALTGRPAQVRRSQPSRHRWRPPRKMRALPLMVPTPESVALGPRRPPAWILVIVSVVLFASGLALGRLLLG